MRLITLPELYMFAATLVAATLFFAHVLHRDLKGK